MSTLLSLTTTERLHRPPTLPDAVIEAHAVRRVERRDRRGRRLARVRSVLRGTGRVGAAPR
jgi:hypothetical protein